MSFRVGERVLHGEAAATVVGRIDTLFVEINYDEPQPRVNFNGDPYHATCVCIHQDLLRPADGLFSLGQFD